MPVFKKGGKSLAAHYRPIFLTCILCKVLEHILASNIVKHRDGQGILYDLQHGFREKRSCETQLIMLIEDRVHTGKFSKIEGLLKTNLQFSRTKSLGEIMIEIVKILHQIKAQQFHNDLDLYHQC